LGHCPGSTCRRGGATRGTRQVLNRPPPLSAATSTANPTSCRGTRGLAWLAIPSRVPDETVTFHAESWRSLALPQPLSFAPPYAEQVRDKEGFAYWWQLLTFVFDLPNPHTFPPLRGFTSTEEAILLRFVETCRELAESTVLSYAGSVHFEMHDGIATLTADHPPREAIRGTVVLFRQMTAESEPASFSAARKIVGSRIRQVRDEHFDQRDEWQRRWVRARTALMSGLLTAMADRKVVRQQGGPDDVPVVGEDVHPTELLSLFQYGELIHWDKKRDAMSALIADDFGLKIQTHYFLEVVIQLSHLCLGYSLLVRRALGLPTFQGT